MAHSQLKFNEIWTSGSGGDAVKRYFLPGALADLLFSEAEPFVQFWIEGIMSNNSVKFFRIWTSGSGGDVV